MVRYEKVAASPHTVSRQEREALVCKTRPSQLSGQQCVQLAFAQQIP